MKLIQHIINAKSVASKSGRTFASENPATEEQIAEVAFGEATDVDAAVDSAERAFHDWSRMPPAERGKLLYKVADKLDERREEFAASGDRRQRQDLSSEFDHRPPILCGLLALLRRCRRQASHAGRRK